MISSFDRQLRRYNYGECIASGPSFAQVQETLKSKQKQLKRDGKGSLPMKSDAISDDELNLMWEKGQLGGNTPDSYFTDSVVFLTQYNFGLRGSAEHRDMCWGDIELKSDLNGTRILGIH